MDIRVTDARFLGTLFKRMFCFSNGSGFLFAVVMSTLLGAGTLSAMEQKEAESNSGQAQQQPTGLANLGNTCFVNSVLQCLFEMNELNTQCAQSQQADRLVQSYLAAKNNHANIGAFIGAVRAQLEMAHGQQEDAHAFLLRLMGVLDPTTHLSVLQGAQTMTCASCHATTTNDKREFSLELDLNAPGDCFEHYFTRGEALSGWNCPQCHNPVNATKKYVLQALPQYLFIQLKRFKQRGTSTSYDRSDELVSCPEKFSFDPRFFAPQAHVAHAYELFGIVCHHGTLTSGHYTAYVKKANGWYYFSDNAQPVLTHIPQKSAAPYILLYRKTRNRWDEYRQGPVVHAESGQNSNNEGKDSAQNKTDKSQRKRTNQNHANGTDSGDEGKCGQQSDPKKQRTDQGNGGQQSDPKKQQTEERKGGQKKPYDEAAYKRALSSEKNLRGANLEGADFTGADLRGVDLTGATISGANFTDANLTKAVLVNVTAQGTLFIHADLTGAVIIGVNANLRGSDFSRSILDYATISEANLTYCNFTGAHIDCETIFRKANLSWTKFHKVYLNNIIFDNADLSHAEFFGMQGMNTAIFRNQTKLTEAKFVGIEMQNVLFNQVDLTGATFNNVQIIKSLWANKTTLNRSNFLAVTFDHTTIHDTDFFGATLKNVVFMNGCDLLAVNMQRITIEKVIFQSITLNDINFAHATITHLCLRNNPRLGSNLNFADATMNKCLFLGQTINNLYENHIDELRFIDSPKLKTVANWFRRFVPGGSFLLSIDKMFSNQRSVGDINCFIFNFDFTRTDLTECVFQNIFLINSESVLNLKNATACVFKENCFLNNGEADIDTNTSASVKLRSLGALVDGQADDAHQMFWPPNKSSDLFQQLLVTFAASYVASKGAAAAAAL